MLVHDADIRWPDEHTRIAASAFVEWIAAIEAEARTTPPALDVERLARALASVTGYGSQDTEYGTEYDIEGARLIATEYARLSASGGSPE